MVPRGSMLTEELPRHLGDLGRRGGESGSRPRAAGQEAFPLQASVPHPGKGRRVVVREPSPPFPGFVGVSHSGSSTSFLFLSHPAPKMSLLLSTLVKPSLGCWRGFGAFGYPSNNPRPWCLGPLLIPVAGPGARLVEMLVLDVSYRHTTPLSSSFLPHTIPILDIPKGPASQQNKPVALAPSTLHTAGRFRLGTERRPRPWLMCWFPVPRHHHHLLWATDQVLQAC